MLSRRAFNVFSIAAVSLTIGGCGILVPEIKEIWDADIPENIEGKISPKITGTAQIEYEIIERIQCDLRVAVQEANRYHVLAGASQNSKFTVIQEGLFPANWGAQVALSLQVDESSALNPGLTLNQIMPNAVKVFGPGSTGTVVTSQSFNLGLGANLSSTATRIDKFNPYWSVAFLMEPIKPNSSCYPQNDPFRRLSIEPATSSPLIIDSDLGIKDWLVGSMTINDLVPSSKGGLAGNGGPKPESISIEIKFVIITSGNVTPTWKLVRVSANTGSTPFFNAGRTRTHDLIITIGPNTTQTNNSHLASQIGNAVSNANRALIAPP
jgi:hypothetical protein